MHQFCKSDAIGGHYCIEKELDAIVIRVDAIGMIYRIDFEQEMQYVETIASDKFGCITIDFLCNMQVVLHRFRIWVQLGSTIAMD